MMAAHGSDGLWNSLFLSAIFLHFVDSGSNSGMYILNILQIPTCRMKISLRNCLQNNYTVGFLDCGCVLNACFAEKAAQPPLLTLLQAVPSGRYLHLFSFQNVGV